MPIFILSVGFVTIEFRVRGCMGVRHARLGGLARFSLVHYDMRCFGGQLFSSRGPWEREVGHVACVGEGGGQFGILTLSAVEAWCPRLSAVVQASWPRGVPARSHVTSLHLTSRLCIFLIFVSWDGSLVLNGGTPNLTNLAPRLILCVLLSSVCFLLRSYSFSYVDYFSYVDFFTTSTTTSTTCTAWTRSCTGTSCSSR